MKLTDDGTGGDQGTMAAPKDTKRRAAPEREKDEATAAAPSEVRPARPEGVRTRASGQELTTANKILVAALKLDSHQETFTAEDLIVVAWELFPESFGLAGYREKYPDSNRVLSKLMGSVGLCSRGWLEQVSTKTYRMTTSGRKLIATVKSNAAAAAAAPPATNAPRSTEATAAVTEGAAPSRVRRTEREPRTRDVPSSTPPAIRAAEPASSVEIAPQGRAPVSVAEAQPAAIEPDPSTDTTSETDEEEEETLAPVVVAPVVKPAPPARPIRPVGSDFEGLPVLQRLALSVASQKFTRGGLVTFLDACQFWAINQSVNPNHLQPRLHEIEAMLKRAETFIQATGGAIRVNDRLEVTLTTVIGLQGLHRMLTQRYHRELESIMKRATSPAEGASDDDGD